MSRGAVSWEWDSKAVSPEQRVSQLGVGLQRSQSGAEGQSVRSWTPKQSVRSRGAVSWEWDSKAVSPEQRVSHVGSGTPKQSVRSRGLVS